MTAIATNMTRRTPNTAAGPTLVHLLRSEWIKITSLPTTWLTLAGMLAIGMAAGVMAVQNTATIAEVVETSRLMFDLTQIAAMVGPLFVGILGVSALGAEYASGSIVPTMLAQPRRTPVLAAKAILLFLLSGVTAAVMALGSWALSYSAAAGTGVDFTLTNPEVFIPIGGLVLYLACVPIFGLGIAAIVRSTTTGAIIVVVMATVGPGISTMLPKGVVWAIVQALFIGNAGYNASQSPLEGAPLADATGYVSPGIAMLLVIAWTTIAIVVGSIMLRKRDV